MSDMAFNTMLSDIDSFSYDQCVMLLSRLTQVFKARKRETTESEMSPIDQFFGTVSDEDSEKMLQAVQECRSFYAEVPA